MPASISRYAERLCTARWR